VIGTCRVRSVPASPAASESLVDLLKYWFDLIAKCCQGMFRSANSISRPSNVVVGAYRRCMSKLAALRETAARSHAPRASARGSVIPWYSPGMTAKRKVSVSLDEDLVAELETADEALSGQVNEAIRAEVERRRRNRLLTGMLDSLDAEYGPVDDALVAKYTELL
jgi:hypothetical protein